MAYSPVSGRITKIIVSFCETGFSIRTKILLGNKQIFPTPVRGTVHDYACLDRTVEEIHCDIGINQSDVIEMRAMNTSTETEYAIGAVVHIEKG